MCKGASGSGCAGGTRAPRRRVVVTLISQTHGSDLDRAGQRLQAEDLFRAQLIDSLEQDSHGPYRFDGVSCAHKRDGLFECHAGASRSYGGFNLGQSGPTAVAESEMSMGFVFCDEKGCSSEPTG